MTETIILVALMGVYSKIAFLVTDQSLSVTHYLKSKLIFG